MGLREGAWINANTGGGYAWLDHRARFSDMAVAAEALDLPLRTIKVLGTMGWDLGATPYQRLLWTVLDAGLVRVRISDGYATFEFRVPIEQAVEGCRHFVVDHLDPTVVCRFHNLTTGQSQVVRMCLLAGSVESKK